MAKKTEEVIDEKVETEQAVPEAPAPEADLEPETEVEE